MDEIIREALEESRRRSKGKRLINYYTIPEYTHHCLARANLKAKLMLQNGYTPSSFTKDFCYRIFGEVEADRIYPTHKTADDYGDYVVHIPETLGPPFQ